MYCKCYCSMDHSRSMESTSGEGEHSRSSSYDSGNIPVLTSHSVVDPNMMIITTSQVVTNKTIVVQSMVIQWTIMEVTMVNIMTLIQVINTLLIMVDQDMGIMNNVMKHSVMITIILDMMYTAMDPDVNIIEMYPLSSNPHPFRWSMD